MSHQHATATAAHCHFSYRLPSGYRSFGWWPTPDDALHAADVHAPGTAGVELISEHAPNCACPKVEGSPA